jgi:hypothetical protein
MSSSSSPSSSYSFSPSSLSSSVVFIPCSHSLNLLPAVLWFLSSSVFVISTSSFTFLAEFPLGLSYSFLFFGTLVN